MRTRELTVAEKFYVDAHGAVPVVDVAKALGTSVKSVEKYLSAKSTVHVTPAKIEVETPPPEEKKVRSLGKSGMVNQDGTVVMTQNAAEIGDEVAKQSKKALKSVLDKDTYVINKDLPVS